MNFFFSSRRRHTRSLRDWTSDVCSSDLGPGDLDDQHRPGGERVAVVERATANHGEVGLRLGGVVERDGRPDAHVIARSECALKGRPRPGDGRRMSAPLGLLHDEEAVEQLYPLILVEEALLDEPIVLSPGEAAGLDRRYAHVLDQRYIRGGRISNAAYARPQRPRPASRASRCSFTHISW